MKMKTEIRQMETQTQRQKEELKSSSIHESVNSGMFEK